MSSTRPTATRKALDTEALNRFALAYVGRYATTRAKLATYLSRKIRERGWSDDVQEPPIAAIVARFVDAGYVDDAMFAASRSGALSRRGFGSRRIEQALSADGIDRELAATFGHDDAAAFTAAEAFARRRRIGPFAQTPADDVARKKAFAAMLRAGHGFELATKFVKALPGEIPDHEDR